MNSPAEFALLGKNSQENYNSALQPWFMQDSTPSPEIIKNSEEVNEMLTLVPLPMYLVNFYKYIGSARVEYYFGVWTLMSLKNILTRYNIFKEHSQNDVIDFASMSVGGGFCVVASLDPSDNKIFFRNDGGNNGWAREEHWNFIKSYKPLINDKLDFIQWTRLINGKTSWLNELQGYIVNLDYKLVNN